jgi:hypothetical protein
MSYNSLLHDRPELFQLKIKYGTVYGMIAGLAFALAAWGTDAYILYNAHVLNPWAKLLIGMIVCLIAGVLAGFVTARSDHWLVALSAWFAAGAVFAWQTVTLPLQTTQSLAAWLKPELAGLITASTWDELSGRFWLALVWISIFVLIMSVIQMAYVENAVFASNSLGRLAPFLLGTFFMISSGLMIDTFNNMPLRGSIRAMDQTIQFVIDHQRMETDPADARANHTGALRGILEIMTQDRSMVIGGYSADLGEINILVQFDESLVNCVVLYEQPSFCKQLQ